MYGFSDIGAKRKKENWEHVLLLIQSGVPSLICDRNLLELSETEGADRWLNSNSFQKSLLLFIHFFLAVIKFEHS